MSTGEPGTKPRSNRAGCMGALLLVLGLGFGGLTLMMKGIAALRWQSKPHVTATVLGSHAEHHGNVSQDTASTTCTRIYQVPGYPEPKDATVPCMRFLPLAPDPGDAVEVAYGGTGSPVAMADIVGVGAQELACCGFVPGGILLLVIARRRKSA